MAWFFKKQLTSNPPITNVPVVVASTSPSSYTNNYGEETLKKYKLRLLNALVHDIIEESPEDTFVEVESVSESYGGMGSVINTNVSSDFSGPVNMHINYIDTGGNFLSDACLTKLKKVLMVDAL